MSRGENHERCLLGGGDFETSLRDNRLGLTRSLMVVALRYMSARARHSLEHITLSGTG